MRSLLFLLLIFNVNSVFGLNQETQDLLIEKIEGSLSAHKDQTVETDYLLVRLADLYAERARAKSIEQTEKECDNCLGAKQDRLKAIKYYKRAEKTPDNRVYSKVILQLNYLYNIEGRPTAGYKVLSSGLNKIQDTKVKALVHHEIGEYFYNKGKYKIAKDNFSKAKKKYHYKFSQTLYKLAWSEYHLGNTNKSISLLKRILGDAELLKTHQLDSSSYDMTYHQVIAQDYASLLTQKTVGYKSLVSIKSFSPEGSLKSILSGVAQELTRLGRYGEANATWKFLTQNTKLSSNEEIEMRLNRFEGLLASKSFKAAKAEFAQITKTTKNVKPDSALQTRIKNALIRWHKLDGTKPTFNLLISYENYISAFPKDIEMYKWAADIASKRKDPVRAKKWLRKSYEVANKKDKQDLLEAELVLTEVNSKDKAKLDTYDFFIKNSKDSNKVFEVKYQKAFLLFNNKNYKEAAKMFSGLVKENNRKYKSLTRKAANLHIDSLVAMKRHEDIVKFSGQYKSTVKPDRAHFENKRQEAILNIANSEKTAKKLTKKTYTRLTSIPTGKSNKNSKNTFRHLIYYSDLNDYITDLEKFTKRAINSKLFKARELEKIKGKHLFALEMQLKFKAAKKFVSKTSSKRESEILKKAILTQLTGQNPKSDLQKYIKATRSIYRANSARITLIESSRTPWSEIANNKVKLLKTKGTINKAVFIAYMKKPSEKQFNKYKKLMSKNSFERQYIQRDLDLKAVASQIRNAQKHKISRRSQYLTGKSIKKRVDLIASLESSLNAAVNSGDVVMQLVFVEALEELNERTREEILKLPEPKNLSHKERKTYKKLVVKQLAPFRTAKNKYAKAKKRILSNKKSMVKMQNVIAAQSSAHKRKISNHFKALKKYVDSGFYNTLEDSISEIPDRPNSKVISKVWVNMKKNPLDVSAVEKALKVEEQRGNDLVAGYLSQRKSLLAKRVKQ